MMIMIEIIGFIYGTNVCQIGRTKQSKQNNYYSFSSSQNVLRNVQ